MTSRQLTKALAQLGITQMGLARTLKVNERTVRDWVGERSPVPTTVAMLLNLMIDTNKNVEDLRA